jgi:predicted SAM-dependent methyltransferase
MSSVLKRIGKRLLRPIWARLSAGIDHRLQPVQTAIGDLSQRVTSVELQANHVPVLDRQLGDIDDKVQTISSEIQMIGDQARRLDEPLHSLETRWNQHVPVFLNMSAVLARLGRDLHDLQNHVRSSQEQLEGTLSERFDQIEAENSQASARFDAAIGQLWERCDFVRREALLEVRYSPRASGRSTTNGELKIIDKKKVDLAKANGVRLNLGCGHIALKGYINVDVRELPGVDIVTEAGILPFAPDSVCEIFSSHMLEHFPQEDLTRRLLPYWLQLLAPGGTFRAIVPDSEALVSRLADGSYSFEDFREVLFGGEDHGGNLHYNLFTPELLTNILRSSGFVDVDCTVKGRPNGKYFEFEVVGTKPLNKDSR